MRMRGFDGSVYNDGPYTEKTEHKRRLERQKCWSQWKGDLNRAEELLQRLEQVPRRRSSWGRQ